MKINIPVGATLFLKPDDEFKEGEDVTGRATTGAVHCCKSQTKMYCQSSKSIAASNGEEKILASSPPEANI